MVSSGAAAAHIFIGIARFRELIEQGAITKQAPGQYDLDVVRREAFEHLRRDRGGHGTAELSNERAELAREQTASVKFKNAVMRGDYVSLEMIFKKAEVMFSVFRERILGIPGKIADALTMRTRDEIEIILREELYEALDQLTNPADLGGGSGGGRHVPPSMPDRKTAA
jgi:phage terminase Nu1 subunit (DNA packaging protein)